jgi:hypothetical protein
MVNPVRTRRLEHTVIPGGGRAANGVSAVRNSGAAQNGSAVRNGGVSSGSASSGGGSTGAGIATGTIDALAVACPSQIAQAWFALGLGERHSRASSVEVDHTFREDCRIS